MLELFFSKIFTPSETFAKKSDKKLLYYRRIDVRENEVKGRNESKILMQGLSNPKARESEQVGKPY